MKKGLCWFIDWVMICGIWCCGFGSRLFFRRLCLCWVCCICFVVLFCVMRMVKCCCSVCRWLLLLMCGRYCMLCCLRLFVCVVFGMIVVWMWMLLLCCVW